MWNPTYFVATVSEQIKQYIKNQKVNSQNK